MKLTKKDIKTLVSCGRLGGMPKGTYVAGFDDIDGRYYPIYALDAFFCAGRECELYTHLATALGGVEFRLRFI